MTIEFAQLGKNGVTEGFIERLKNDFKNHGNVKIAILKSAGRDREKKAEYAEQILNKLGENYAAKIIGFTIIVKKWKKPMR